MTSARLPVRRERPRRSLALAGAPLALALLAALAGSARLIAQIEGERGIAPVASTADIEVDHVAVDASGKDGADARRAGWAQAARLAWDKVGGPRLGDGELSAMVSAVVVEREQIGPRRYIATLGVTFDRTKAGDMIAAANGAVGARSAPLLVIPLLESGGARQVFEVRGAWQRAWANFQTSASPIDYVRPVGAGADSLLLTAGQVGRRNRAWWRALLDRFDAADVLIPVARIERQWPGGPVRGTFTARYGPDDTYLDSFTLAAPDEQGVPAMLNAALVRIDLIYRDALARGALAPDPTLTAQQRAYAAALAEVKARLALLPAPAAAPIAGAPPTAPAAAPAPVASGAYAVQVASPESATLDAALAAIKATAGVQAVATTSIAIGGTSVLRVTFAGDLEALAAALRARGWQVAVGSGALSIRR